MKPATRRVMMALVLAVSTLLSGASVAAAQSSDDGPTVITGGDNSSFGVGAKTTKTTTKTGGGSGAEPAVVTPPPSCSLVPVDPQPAESTRFWEGHSAVEGVVVHWVCQGGVLPADARWFFQGVGAPNTPDPFVVAAEAYNSIPFPVPVPHIGPSPLRVAVKNWVYLSVPDPGSLSATAAVPGLSVTATARLASSSWSMGEWLSLDNHSPVPAFTCSGGGRQPASPVLNVAEAASTGCAYWYRWRSLPDRTGDAGTWPVTVTTTWAISWAASNGATGTATRVQTSAALRVHVGEWRAVNVPVDAEIEGGGR